MKIRLIGSAAVVAWALSVTMLMACPKEEASGVKTVKGKLPCAHKCDQPCDPAKCEKHAKTVADRIEDGRSEGEHKSKKSGGCGTKLHSEKSLTVSDTPESSGTKGKGCCAKKKAATVADKSDGHSVKPCPLTGEPIKDEDCPLSKKKSAILSALPSLKYRVDGEMIGCSKTAAAMAKKSGNSIEYVVGDTVFFEQGEAVAKLASLIDSEAESMRSLQFVAGGKCHRCPMTAKSVAKSSNTDVKYRVGGVDFEKKSDAEKALDAIAEAVAKVSMRYKVDGKTYGCDKTAGEKCKKTGKYMSYVIGDQETDCRTTAQLMLAEARVRIIVEVALEALNGSSAS